MAEGPTVTIPKRALDIAGRLAMRGAGNVEPNPLVGAVIVRDGRVIGMGHHARFGGVHAERAAINACAARGHDARGAEMYVTLEPCTHTGKQPPCTQAVLDAGIARVVYAVADPNPVAAGGAEVLRSAGVEAVLDRSSGLAIAASEPFVHRVTSGLPWVIAKWAQTIDGRIATRTGESKWISGEGSRRRVHGLRSRVDAIVTGLGTLHADDPMLTARGVSRVRRVARRVVIDPDLEIPLGCSLVRSAPETPTIVACSKDLLSAGIAERRRAELEAAGVELFGVPEQIDSPGKLRLEMLFALLSERYGAANVMVEAGAGLLGSLFEADLICEARVYLAPLMLADAHALTAARGRVAERLSDGRRFSLRRARRVADDVELIYRRSPQAGV
ncbi:MAG: bifunctional diaminohydroxyphosphoribosylaminopyrimidine deaminase/5-amino-6-(5-phosphoribosylamino)uracil reductase RibD [Planctomycetota bacterium]